MSTTERLEARITPELKALMRRAAALEGRTITDFVATAIQEAAQRSLERHSVIRLTVEDQERFANALLSPPEPTAALKRAFARRRTLLGLE